MIEHSTKQPVWRRYSTALGRILKRQAVLALAVIFGLTAYVGGVSTPVAAATTSTTDIIMRQLPTDSSRNVILRLPATQLEADRPYLLYGSYGATSNIGTLQAMVMRCHAKGVPSTYSSWSTRNHLGAEYGDTGIRSIAGQWLFTPKVSADYVCELIAKAGRVGNPNGRFTIQSNYTKLTLDTTPRDGAVEWRQPADAHFGNPDSKCCSRPRAVDTLWHTQTVPLDTTSVRVYTGAEVSVESTGGKAPLRVRLVHFVRQLDNAGRYCHVTSVKDELTIDNLLHHYKFNHIQTVPYDKNCSNRFNVKVFVEYLPGSPERHGGVVHNGTYSSAFIIPNP